MKQERKTNPRYKNRSVTTLRSVRRVTSLRVIYSNKIDGDGEEVLNLNHTHIYKRGYHENERIANAVIDEYPGRGSKLILEFL